MLWSDAAPPAWTAAADNLAAAVAALFPAVPTLRRLRSRLDAVMRAVPQALMLIDNGGDDALLNEPASALLGLQAGTVAPERVRAAFSALLMRAANRPALEAQAGTLFGDPGFVARDWVWEFAEPDPATYRVASIPLSGKHVDGRLWVFDDVTQFVEANRALEEARSAADRANQAKSRFLATMTHEIRTPMNAIIGLSRELMAEPMDWRHREWVSMIKASGENLLRIVNDVLDFSKIEAGRLELVPAPMSIGDLIGATCGLMRGTAGAKGLRLRSCIDPAVPDRIVGDETRLRQILMNLVSNAIKFTEVGEVAVDVDTISTAGQVLLRMSVRDTGPGITPEIQARLFTPYTQANAAVATTHGGTGLGLAICRQLVDLMGGRIGLDSQPGAGARFWFALPLVPAPAAPKPAAAVGGAVAPARPARILVAEDNAINQQLVRLILAHAGHSAEFADNGEAAVGMAASDRYDLILMDVQMPIMDGPTATRSIRAGGPNADTPIVALTAVATEAEVDACLAAGMNDHATKPIDPAALLATVARWARTGPLPA